MLKLLVFLLLLVTCWPLALAALIAYPFIWLILLPFRLLGIVVGGTFHLVEAIFLLPLLFLRPRRQPAYAPYPQVLPRRTYY